MFLTLIHYRSVCSVALSLSLVFLAFSESYAQAVFKYPRVDGFPMDGCLDFAADCEQTAADYFCGQKGYTNARNWKTEDSLYPTKTMRTREVCDTSQWICGTFSLIDCATPRSPLTPTTPIRPGSFSGTKQYTSGPERGITYNIKLGDLSEQNGQLNGRYSLVGPEGSTKISDGTKWDSEILFMARPPAIPSCAHLFRGVLSGDTMSGDFTTENDCHGGGKWSVSWDLALQMPPVQDGHIEVGVFAGGLGIGEVISEPTGLSCPSNASSPKCVSTFPGTVTLTAIAHDGSVFTGWSGACQGVSDKCTISGYNQSLWVAAGFDVDTYTPPKELTIDDAIGDLITFWEVSQDAADVIKRISGKEAFRKYNWMRDVIVKNRSNNLRGVVMDRLARRIYIFADKTSDKLVVVTGMADATRLFCGETLVNIDAILDSTTIQDKQLAINLEFARLGAKSVNAILQPVIPFTPRNVYTILYVTKYINPVYWMDRPGGEEAIRTVDFWADELDTFVSKQIDSATGEWYDLVEISSNRFTEYVYLNSMLSTLSGPCGYVPDQ